MRLLIVFLIFQTAISIKSIYAQSTTFSLLFDSPARECPIDVFEDENGNIHVLWIYYDYNSFNEADYKDNRQLIVLSCFDNLGNVLHEKRFDEDLSFEKILPVSDSSFIGVGTYDLSGEQMLLVCEIGFDGELIWKKEYDNNAKSGIEIKEMIHTSKNTYVVAGNLWENDDIDMFLCEFSSMGELMKFRHFELPKSEFVYSIEENFNSEGYFVSAFGITHDTLSLFSELVMLDFNNEFEVKNIVEFEIMYGKTKILTDSTYLAVGEGHESSYTDYTCLRNDIYNNQHERISRTVSGVFREYDMPAMQSCIGSNDTILYVAGATSKSKFYGNFPESNAVSKIIIEKKSLLNPETIYWQKFYGEEDVFYLAQNTLATSDGGVFVTATRFVNDGSNDTDMYLLKVDSNGNLFPNSNEEQPAITARETMVYPNPGYGELSVRKAAQHKQLKFCLYNAAGILVIEQWLQNNVTSFNTESLPAGTYFYKITGENNFQESGKWIKL